MSPIAITSKSLRRASNSRPTQRPLKVTKHPSSRSLLKDCPLEILFHICSSLSSVYDLKNVVLSSNSMAQRLRQFVYVLTEEDDTEESMIPKVFMSQFSRLSTMDDIPSYSICIREHSLSMSTPPMDLPIAVEEELYLPFKSNVKVFLIVRQLLGMRLSEDGKGTFLLFAVHTLPWTTVGMKPTKDSTPKAQSKPDPGEDALKALFMLKSVETKTVRLVPPSRPSSAMDRIMESVGPSYQPEFKFSECRTTVNVKLFV